MGCQSIRQRVLVVLGLLLGVVVHGKEFEDKLLPQAVRDRRACFTTALRKTLAYDLNQNYVQCILLLNPSVNVAVFGRLPMQAFISVRLMFFTHSSLTNLSNKTRSFHLSL